MNKEAIKKKYTDDVLFNIIILILGVLILSVGLLIFYTKMAGTRSLTVVEGTWPQIGGIIFILFGIYLVILSIKKLITHYRKKIEEDDCN
ncbi:MAG: hypothetical protein C4550_00175 [Nitrospiraceae bacterium]|nr:MAG: hypothetical protein C4550_00175 [Nitrospiraceae bacterium]